MAFAWVFVAGLAVVVGLVYARFFRRSEGTEIPNLVPGPPTLPLVGNLFDVAVSRKDVMRRLMNMPRIYGSIYRTWMGPIPIVHISRPEYAEIVLNSSRHTRKGNFYRFLYPWLGSGLLTSSGKKWFDHRKLITPTFHFKILDKFLEVFSEKAAILVDKLRDRSESAEAFDIYPFVTLCALDIICETAMGIKVQIQNGQSPTYVASLYNNKLWLHPDFVYYSLPAGREYRKHLKILHDFTDRVIRDRKNPRQREKQIHFFDRRKKPESDAPVKKRQAFLDLLFDASESNRLSNLSDNDIREEVDTFMFEGHDKTAAGICWTLHCLGLNPRIQNDVAQQLKDIFGDGKLQPPTMRDLGEMKLLERVIKESLRLYPSVSFISRKLDDDVALGDYIIPADTTVAIDIISIHRNPEIFPNPETFDPDRWLQENLQDRHPYSYIPFSAGPRNCIGQKFALLEEKFVLSYILRNYEVESVQQPDELTLMHELILRPLEGIRLKIRKRE